VARRNRGRLTPAADVSWHAARLTCMRVIRTETSIDASPASVWAVLTDFAGYPEWNPFITNAEGTLAVGEILTLRMVPGGKPQTFTPVVRVVRENEELRWLGALRWSWLFSAEHRWSATAPGSSTARCSAACWFPCCAPRSTRPSGTFASSTRH
jgi:hypothetical protein